MFILTITTIFGLSGIYSYFDNGDVFLLSSQVPLVIWTGFFLVILAIIVYFKAEKTCNYPRALIGCGISANGYDDISEYQYNDVNWVIQAPRVPRWYSESEYYRDLPDRILVKTPPKCSKCKTELEQKKSLLYGYFLKCPDCGFSKWNSHHYYEDAERVKKIAKRDIEQEVKTILEGVNH